LHGITNTGFFISSDLVHQSAQIEDITSEPMINAGLTPEEISRQCCLQFLEEIYYVNI
jgi:hypothetical protein